ncbi:MULTISPECIES: SPOR domain-containing protein [Polaromonas]|uniref:SPOR domain-containing protein n=1 Tax=Polaromonas aquatica TaxID=332657 RepID=A0ABW1U0X7_9BURK
MPFFNFRRAGSAPAANAASATQPESVEVIRKRAKHRLIGAAVLVLAGVVGFPLLFDTQPRPIAVDIPIEIPGKNAVKPLMMPAKQDASAPVPAPAVAVAPVPAPAAPATPEKVAAASSLSSKEEILTEKVAQAPVQPAQPAIKTEAKPAPKPEPRPAAAVDDGARAKALLNGQAVAAPAPAAAEGRMVVQVGAFADVAKAREARLKLEKAGLKTYTQVAETKDGKRIRVRVGPFATKADAEKAASKIKTLDLPAAILTL